MGKVALHETVRMLPWQARVRVAGGGCEGDEADASEGILRAVPPYAMGR